jgi:hypothetical protein
MGQTSNGPWSVTRISEETGIHVATLYVWRKGWRLEGQVVPASQKDPEGWAADKLTVVLETAAFNATDSAPIAANGPGAVFGFGSRSGSALMGVVSLADQSYQALSSI